MDPWYNQNLVCPIDHAPLQQQDGALVSAAGRRYPVVDGIPVLLLDNAEQTIGVASTSLKRAQGDSAVVDSRAPELYLESLGISEAEKQSVIELVSSGNGKIDPVVSCIVAATSGHSYKHLLGKLDAYPVPELRFPDSHGQMFLELGCNWGRWCIAAARKGYTVVGIDPSLGAVMAARRVARQLGLPNRYLVADARFLPFKAGSFDAVFSYSVLQHLQKDNVRKVLEQVGRILKLNGTSLIQMPNFLGIRSLQNQARRRFREAEQFEVRYWSLPELRKMFTEKIGRTSISVDCYFGLGLQKSDIEFMTPMLRRVIYLSELLRSISCRIGILKYLADSVYVTSICLGGARSEVHRTRKAAS
jgi:SAM-dependent methyltransferase/uncharacterized protein YbaR (Trm112 family)